MRIEDVRTREDLAEYCREAAGNQAKIFRRQLDDEVQFQLWMARCVARDLEHAAYKLKQLKSERDAVEAVDLCRFVEDRHHLLQMAVNALGIEQDKAERAARRLRIPAPAAE
jgi:hypothetical protein